MSQSTILKQLAGRMLGISALGNLVSNGIAISRPCVDCSITVGAEGASVANQRAITIQLKDNKGNDINYVEEVDLILFLTADKLAYVVTGGSTGIAIGTDGALQTVIAKKLFRATSEADGDIDLTWTDTGTEAAFLGVKLPNGRIVMSDALTNA
jgi:hypothetical protein